MITCVCEYFQQKTRVMTPISSSLTPSLSPSLPPSPLIPFRLDAASVSNATAPAGDREGEEEEEEAIAPPLMARGREGEGVKKAWVVGRTGRRRRRRVASRRRRRTRRDRVGSPTGGMLFGAWEGRGLGRRSLSCFVLGEGRLSCGIGKVTCEREKPATQQPHHKPGDKQSQSYGQ